MDGRLRVEASVYRINNEQLVLLVEVERTEDGFAPLRCSTRQEISPEDFQTADWSGVLERARNDLRFKVWRFALEPQISKHFNTEQELASWITKLKLQFANCFMMLRCEYELAIRFEALEHYLGVVAKIAMPEADFRNRVDTLVARIEQQRNFPHVMISPRFA